MQFSESEYSHSAQARQNSPYWVLSRQLQLRLRYARLKVDHGWQKQSLNEVENLYFHHHHFRDSAASSSSNVRSLPFSSAPIRLDVPGPSGSSSSNSNVPLQEAAPSSVSVFRANQQQDDFLMLHSQKASMFPQAQATQQNTSMQANLHAQSVPTPTFQLPSATPAPAPMLAPQSTLPLLSTSTQITSERVPRDSATAVSESSAIKSGDAGVQAHRLFASGSATNTPASTSMGAIADSNLGEARQDRDVPPDESVSGGASTEVEASNPSHVEAAQGPPSHVPRAQNATPAAAPVIPKTQTQTQSQPQTQPQSRAQLQPRTAVTKPPSMTYDSFFRSHDGPIPMTATSLATYGYGPYINFNTNTNKINTAVVPTSSPNAGPSQFDVAPPGLPTQVGETSSDVAMADVSRGSKITEM